MAACAGKDENAVCDSWERYNPSKEGWETMKGGTCRLYWNMRPSDYSLACRSCIEGAKYSWNDKEYDTSIEKDMAMCLTICSTSLLQCDRYDVDATVPIKYNNGKVTNGGDIPVAPYIALGIVVALVGACVLNVLSTKKQDQSGSPTANQIAPSPVTPGDVEVGKGRPSVNSPSTSVQKGQAGQASGADNKARLRSQNGEISWLECLMM
jgi:hypothetical protein